MIYIAESDFLHCRLAQKFGKVTGVEGYERAVEFARKNIENARIENTDVFCENVGDWLAENAADLREIDFVLLDPPRAGTEKETIGNLLKIAPKEISYVSCEPSTLARDLRILSGKATRLNQSPRSIYFRKLITSKPSFGLNASKIRFIKIGANVIVISRREIIF